MLEDRSLFWLKGCNDELGMQMYCYTNGNSLILFNITAINKCYTNKYIEVVISKPTTTSVWEKERSKRTQQ